MRGCVLPAVPPSRGHHTKPSDDALLDRVHRPPQRHPPSPRLLPLPMPIRRTVALVSPDGIVAGQVEVAGQDANVTVPHQPPQGAQIGPRPQHLDGEGMAEPVAVDMHPHAPGQARTDLLHRRLSHRVAVERQEEVPIPGERRLGPAQRQVAGQVLVRLPAKADVAPLAKLGVLDADLAGAQIYVVAPSPLAHATKVRRFLA